MPGKWEVVDRLRTSDPIDGTFPGSNCVALFNAAYAGLREVLATVPAYIAGAPVPVGVFEIYDRTAQAIGVFEKSIQFNKFNSKYDYFLMGQGTLTTQELKGLKLFEGKGKCALCHLSQPGLAPDGNTLPPLFTDFTYDNLGIPANPLIPGGPDLGLGGRADIAANDPRGVQLGKFKVMSLRNIELTAPCGEQTPLGTG